MQNRASNYWIYSRLQCDQWTVITIHNVITMHTCKSELQSSNLRYIQRNCRNECLHIKQTQSAYTQLAFQTR